MILQGKTAVIYGGGGAIGGEAARVFAREGARVFLAGRTLSTLDAVARDIKAAGGQAATALVDALDGQAIDAHLGQVLAAAGRLDVMFNAIGTADTDTNGLTLLEMTADQFSLPITSYTRSYFLTATLAARRMIPHKLGVIMTVSGLPSRMGLAWMAGYGPAMAAKDALTRSLSAELAPQGIRVVGLRPQAMPGTHTIRRSFDVRAERLGMTWEQWQVALAGRTHPRRLMMPAEVAEVAAFLASDRAAGLTGTSVNLTLGSLDD